MARELFIYICKLPETIFQLLILMKKPCSVYVFALFIVHEILKCKGANVVIGDI